MPRLEFVKQPNTGLFEPWGDRVVRYCDRLAPGEMVSGSFRRVRSPENHRCYFMAVKEVYEIAVAHYGFAQNMDLFRKASQIEAGFYDLVETGWKYNACPKCQHRPSGHRLMPIAQSVAYANMDEDEYLELRRKVGDVWDRRFDLEAHGDRTLILALSHKDHTRGV